MVTHSRFANLESNPRWFCTTLAVSRCLEAQTITVVLPRLLHEFSGHGAVTIGAVEKYITDTAWEEGWVEPLVPGKS
ncbi:MAG: hypothetical protein ABJE27_15950, partial [Rhodopirellula bahusiensis]